MKIRGEEIFFVNYEKDEKKVIVYVPLRSYLGLYSKKIKDILTLSDKSSPISDDFFEKLNTYQLVDIVKAHEESKMIIPELSLPITNDCNLRCEYCYFRAGDADVCQTMSKEVIQNVVDAYFECINDYPRKLTNDRISITIAGGGEPTVKFDLFKYAILYIEKKCKNNGLVPVFHMPTNGAHGMEVREFILKHFDEISFSMDGPKFIQDYHRPFKNGKSSYDVVYASAKFYYEHRQKMAFRITVTDYSLKYLKEILDFFDENFKGVPLGIEAMNDFGRAINNHKVQAPDPDEFAARLVDAYKHAEKKKMVIYNSANSKMYSLRTFFCGAVGIPNWTVTCDGRITSCTRDNMHEDFTFGFFDYDNKKIIIDKDKVAKLRDMNILNYKECSDCFCKYNCAGDCPDLRKANMLNCGATKNVGEHMLNSIIEKTLFKGEKNG